MLRSFLTASYADAGLLLMRLGLGAMFLFHGWPKVIGGPARWTKLGGAMANLGIDFFPLFWGFMAAFAEFGGGILLFLGFLHRPAALMMAFTMVVAVSQHVVNGDPFMPKISYPLELMFAFAGLALLGPGRYSVDAKIWKK